MPREGNGEFGTDRDRSAAAQRALPRLTGA